jgi:hypothetical protein
MVRLIRIIRVLFIVLFLSLVGCNNGKQRLNVDLSKIIQPEIKIHRYDLDLFKVSPSQLQYGLEVLKSEYRFFLDTDLSNPVKLGEMKDYLESPRNLGFYEAVKSRYKNVRPLEKELSDAFGHYLYYYPGAKIPRFYTYISSGDYDYPVQFADSVMLIGLDNYLGRDFKPYVTDGLPIYRIYRMNSENILPECMRVLANVIYPTGLPGNNLLEQMVEAGKRLYFIDAMIPQTEDRFKIGFTKEQDEWIVKNEEHVWAALIGNRMLYTTDSKLIRAFMADGPFTAEFSKEAPPRLGEWLGWQIVRKYMENQPGVSLPGMMKEKDAQKILSLSGYKPEK